MRAVLIRLWANTSAASAGEYALVLAMMGAATFAGISLVGGAVNSTFSDINLLFALSSNP